MAYALDTLPLESLLTPVAKATDVGFTSRFQLKR